MTVVEENVLVPPAGYAASEVGLFLAQMDDQNLRLIEDTRGADPAELAWQPAPGMNTIGMLLAHLAVVEAFWFSIASGTTCDYMTVLGIGGDDDGIPLEAGASPPEVLAGKPLEFYDDLLARARAYSKNIAQAWTAADLDFQIERTRRRDKVRERLNRRWIVYHVLEHEAAHYGQINLLRHLYRSR